MGFLNGLLLEYLKMEIMGFHGITYPNSGGFFAGKIQYWLVL